MNLSDKEWQAKQDEVYKHAKKLEKKGLNSDEIFEEIAEKYGAELALDWDEL